MLNLQQVLVALSILIIYKYVLKIDGSVAFN